MLSVTIVCIVLFGCSFILGRAAWNTLDRAHRIRQQRLWDCTLGTVQNRTDKEYPR